MFKQNKKEIVEIDGIRFEMTRKEYKWALKYRDQWLEIMDRRRIITDNEPLVAAPVVKEQLTDAVLKRLFDDDWKDVCVYNMEYEILMTPYYNGQKVYWSNESTEEARKLKGHFENQFPEFEAVDQVTKLVSEKDYPGWAEWSEGEIKFNEKGECTVGTLVIRNKKTGELLRYNGSAWFGVTGRNFEYNPAQYGAGGLAYYGAWFSGFQVDFFAPRAQVAHTR